MKRVFFILTMITLSIFPACKANTAAQPADEAAKQFGYYVAHGDVLKAELCAINTTDHRNFMDQYVSEIKSQIDNNGGLKQVTTRDEEILVSGQKTKITVVWECKGGQVIEKSFILINEDGIWKIDMEQL